MKKLVQLGLLMMLSQSANATQYSCEVSRVKDLWGTIAQTYGTIKFDTSKQIQYGPDLVVSIDGPRFMAFCNVITANAHPSWGPPSITCDFASAGGTRIYGKIRVPLTSGSFSLGLIPYQDSRFQITCKQLLLK